MSVKLKHHIYTSVGGYKTVYADSDIDKSQLERLEKIAKSVYPHVGGKPFLAFFHLDDHNAVYLKVFRSGVDHVGRPKAFVHTVAVRVDGVVPPKPEPDWFIDRDLTQSDIPMLKSRLTTVVPGYDIIQTAHLTTQAELLSNPLLETLLLAAISNRPFYLFGDFFKLMEQLTKISALIPRPSRIRLYVLCPHTVAKWLLPKNSVMTAFLCLKDGQQNLSENASVISLSPFFARNLPYQGSNSKVPYLNFLKRADPDAVAKLIALFERFAPSEPLTFDAYFHLIPAFENCQDMFSFEGDVKTDGIQPSLLLSLQGFLAAGFYKLIIHILDLLAAKVNSEPELARLVLTAKKAVTDPTTEHYDRENILDKVVRRLMITISRRGGIQ